MKLTIGCVLVALWLAVLVAAPALADQERHTGNRAHGHEWQGKGKGHLKGAGVNPRGHVSRRAHANGIPELDPGMAGSAALLLIGGMLVLRDRRRVEPQA